MTAQEILRFIHSKAGLCAARDYLSAFLRLDAMIAVKQARADTLRARRALMRDDENQRALDELEQEIQKDYSALLRQQKTIGDAIRNVPGEMNRLVLESHYLQGLPFFRIAMKLHYDERQIYRYHRRGLEHVAAQLAVRQTEESNP